MKKANTIITMNAIVLLLQRISISSDRRTLNVIKFQAFPYSYYSHDKKGTYPYYISPDEIGLLWTKIIYLKSLLIALEFGHQTDMKKIFQIKN